MTVSIVLADANILFSRTLRDYFLYAADAGAIEIRWSQQVLEEMSRNLRAAMGFTTAQTDRLEALMNDYLEHALVQVTAEAEAEVGTVAMDAKDRHVLAAAISAEADIVLTDNTRHFPRDWMNARGIELINAGDLLVRLAETMPSKIRTAHANDPPVHGQDRGRGLRHPGALHRQARRHRHPPSTRQRLRLRLRLTLRLRNQHTSWPATRLSVTGHPGRR